MMPAATSAGFRRGLADSMEEEMQNLLYVRFLQVERGGLFELVGDA